MTQQVKVTIVTEDTGKPVDLIVPDDTKVTELQDFLWFKQLPQHELPPEFAARLQDDVLAAVRASGTTPTT